jgi:hypothetical protein
LLQLLFPLLLVVLPTLASTLIALFLGAIALDSSFVKMLIFAATTTYPTVNALSSLYFVKPYRSTMLGVFRMISCSSPTTVVRVSQKAIPAITPTLF